MRVPLLFLVVLMVRKPLFCPLLPCPEPWTLLGGLYLVFPLLKFRCVREATPVQVSRCHLKADQLQSPSVPSFAQFARARPMATLLLLLLSPYFQLLHNHKSNSHLSHSNQLCLSPHLLQTQKESSCTNPFKLPQYPQMMMFPLPDLLCQLPRSRHEAM